MHKELIEEIEFQTNEIDRLFEEFELFFEDMNYEKPDIVQIVVMANIIHSFYNGVEKIFDRISKNLDNTVISGDKSHKELLGNMHKETNARGKVISDETYLLLNAYMGFRHFFRHSYAFEFEWDKFRDLAIDLNDIWEKVKLELTQFTEFLSEEK